MKVELIAVRGRVNGGQEVLKVKVKSGVNGVLLINFPYLIVFNANRQKKLLVE